MDFLADSSEKRHVSVSVRICFKLSTVLESYIYFENERHKVHNR